MGLRPAVINTCHDFGMARLAADLGKPLNTVKAEANPPAGSTAKLGLETALRIMLLTGDLRILHAMAGELNCMVLPLPVPEATGDVESAKHLETVTREFADVVGEVAGTAFDGDISDNDLAKIERQWSELVAAGGRMVKHFRSKNAAAKPASAAGAVSIDRAREAA